MLRAVRRGQRNTTCLGRTVLRLRFPPQRDQRHIRHRSGLLTRCQGFGDNLLEFRYALTFDVMETCIETETISGGLSESYPGPEISRQRCVQSVRADEGRDQ